MKLTVCNVCGKNFDKSDREQNACFTHTIGYGSLFDGQTLVLDLCCECFDSLLDGLLGQCKISPLLDGEV